MKRLLSFTLAIFATVLLAVVSFQIVLGWPFGAHSAKSDKNPLGIHVKEIVVEIGSNDPPIIRERTDKRIK